MVSGQCDRPRSLTRRKKTYRICSAWIVTDLPAEPWDIGSPPFALWEPGPPFHREPETCIPCRSWVPLWIAGVV